MEKDTYDVQIDPSKLDENSPNLIFLLKILSVFNVMRNINSLTKKNGMLQDEPEWIFILTLNCAYIFEFKKILFDLVKNEKLFNDILGKLKENEIKNINFFISDNKEYFEFFKKIRDNTFHFLVQTDLVKSNLKNIKNDNKKLSIKISKNYYNTYFRIPDEILIIPLIDKILLAEKISFNDLLDKIIEFNKKIFDLVNAISAILSPEIRNAYELIKM